MQTQQLQPIKNYLVLDKIGDGPVSEVWKAEKEGQLYALKVFDRKFEEGIKVEFQRLKDLDHPNIAKVYEIGTYIDRPCLVMELVEGKPLNRVNVRFLKDEALEQLVADLAKTIQYIHNQRILHGGLKPSNIIVGENGGLKIMDAGFKRVIQTDAIAQIIQGTYSYMAPEQLTNTASKQSDIWSFGLCLYEWLMDLHPFRSSKWESLIEAMLCPKIEIPHFYNKKIPPPISFIILKCLEQDNEKRFQDFDEIITALEADHLAKLNEDFNNPGSLGDTLLNAIISRQRWHLLFYPVAIVGFLSVVLLIPFFLIGEVINIGGIFFWSSKGLWIFYSMVLLGIGYFLWMLVYMFNSKNLMYLEMTMLTTNKEVFLKTAKTLARGNWYFGFPYILLLKSYLSSQVFLLKWFGGDLEKGQASLLAHRLKHHPIGLSYKLKNALVLKEMDSVDELVKRILAEKPDHIARLVPKFYAHH